ncbi:hypothetical protein EJB05_45828, partial [Eragrostis curvula]
MAFLWRTLHNVLIVTLLRETYPTPAAQVSPNKLLSIEEMNTINFSAHTTSSAQPTIIDPKEHKRKRVRERYAQMPKDQKEEFLKKRREAYRQRKTKAIANVEQEKSFPFRSDQSGYKEYTLLTTLKGDNSVQQPFLEEVTTSNQENTHSHENMDCFHTSIVHHRQEVERYQIQPCILTSSEGKQSSAQWSEDHISMSEEQNESLCHPIACTNGDTHTYENPSTPKLTNEKIEAKRARNRAYYANMTNEQRLARCEQSKRAIRIEKLTTSENALYKYDTRAETGK